MQRSLYSRVFSTYAAMTLVGLTLLGLVTTLAMRSAARDLALDELSAVAQVAARLVTSLPASTAAEALATSPDAGETSIGLIDAEANPIDGSDRSRLPVDPSILASSDLVTGTVKPDGGARLAYAIAAVPDTGRSRFVFASQPVAQIAAATRGTLLLVLASVAVYTLMLAFLISPTIRWINDPVYAIQGAARRYARGELDVHLRTDGPPELKRLGDDLNLMADQLRARITAISDQRNQLETILTSMLEGVLLLDSEHVIVSMNDAAGRLLGVTPSSAVGRTLLESVRNAPLDAIASAARTEGTPLERTITLYRERPITLQVHATPLGGTGTTGALIVVNDITRLKHLEDLRRDFVANVSHELKTPITSIKGFVETLLDGAHSDPGLADRFLRIILHHTNRLNQIIEDLLSLSRLEQSDQSITFRTFDVEDLVHGVMDVCTPRAGARGIEIRPERYGEPRARGNPSLLEQALVNLIDNAIKYSPEGSCVSVGISSLPSMLRIVVADNGPGIRAQDVPRIFERFYRTDRARSRELGGTGLGLAIVKHIARAHRGEVRVDSTYGQGSRFTLDIPQDTDPAEETPTDGSYDETLGAW